MKLPFKTPLAWHELVLLFILVLEWVAFSLVGRNFGTYDNACDILRHSCEIGLLALAMTPVVMTGGIDLSVGSLLGLCAVVFGSLWRDHHVPIGLAAGLTLVTGLAAGLLNGTLITRLRLPPLIVTLATFSLFRGLAEALTRGVETYTNFPPAFLALGQDRWLGLPAQTPILVAFVIGYWLLVHRSTFGRSFQAIGFGPENARYAAIPVEQRMLLVYALAGLTAATAAILYTARLGQAKADAGTGYELLAITAAVLGGASIFGGIGSVHGTLLGVAAIAMLNNGLVHARQPREVAGLLTGMLLIASLAASAWLKRLARNRATCHREGSATQLSNTA